MTTTRDWDQWQESWRAAHTSSAQLEAMIERTRRVRRSIVVVRILSAALAFLSLAVVAAALRHAGNTFEITLGAIVGCGIVAVWYMDARNQRNASDKVEAPADEYRATRRVLCERQIRFARLGWLLVALDLVFLTPWWIGGFAVHGAGFHPAQLLTMWLPLGLMSVFVGVTLVMRRRAAAELARLSDQSE